MNQMLLNTHNLINNLHLNILINNRMFMYHKYKYQFQLIQQISFYMLNLIYYVYFHQVYIIYH